MPDLPLRIKNILITNPLVSKPTSSFLPQCWVPDLNFNFLLDEVLNVFWSSILRKTFKYSKNNKTMNNMWYVAPLQQPINWVNFPPIRFKSADSTWLLQHWPNLLCQNWHYYSKYLHKQRVPRKWVKGKERHLHKKFLLKM